MKFVGASSKMYLGYQASLQWLEGVHEQVASRPELAGTVTAFVIPSFPVLESAMRIFAGTDVVVGAQNCAATPGGAFTGEVSALMLAELGVRLVEIGHAERRALFHEDEAVIRNKTAAALDAGLTPLLCVGEAKATDPRQAAKVCAEQALSALDGADVAQVLLAYEPVWAIGAAAPAAPAYVNSVLYALRGLLPEPAAAARIVYGGSAGPGLLPQLPTADGLFLGRFAHDPGNFGAVLDDALR